MISVISSLFPSAKPPVLKIHVETPLLKSQRHWSMSLKTLFQQNSITAPTPFAGKVPLGHNTKYSELEVRSLVAPDFFSA